MMLGQKESKRGQSQEDILEARRPDMQEHNML